MNDYRRGRESGEEFVSRLLMREKVYNFITILIPAVAFIAVALLVHYGP